MKALLVAAHGDGDSSLANLEIRSLTERAAKLLGVQEWIAAFHRGEPGYTTALDSLRAEEVVVVPLMAAAGYYCQTVLPREIAKARSFSTKSTLIAGPVGTSRSFRKLALKRVSDLLITSGYNPHDSGLMVVGHGTRRHPESRVSTEEMTRELRAQFQFKRVSAAFLDEEPGPAEALEQWRRADINQGIILPFLIASGTHSLVDIPKSVEKFPGTLLVDQALGSADAVAQIIAERANELRAKVGGAR